MNYLIWRLYSDPIHFIIGSAYVGCQTPEATKMIDYHLDECRTLLLLYLRDIIIIVVFHTYKRHLVHYHLDQLIPLSNIIHITLLLIFSILKHAHELGVGINPYKILTFRVLLQLLDLKNSMADTHQVQDCVIIFFHRLIRIGLFFFSKFWSIVHFVLIQELFM